MWSMASNSILMFYAFVKLVYLYSIVKIFLKFDNLRQNILFLSIFYTLGIAFISFIFFVAPNQNPNYREWGIFLAKTLGLSYVYFRLLDRFDEGFLLIVMLVLGLGLVYF